MLKTLWSLLALILFSLPAAGGEDKLDFIRLQKTVDFGQGVVLDFSFDYQQDGFLLPGLGGAASLSEQFSEIEFSLRELPADKKLLVIEVMQNGETIDYIRVDNDVKGHKMKDMEALLAVYSGKASSSDAIVLRAHLQGQEPLRLEFVSPAEMLRVDSAAKEEARLVRYGSLSDEEVLAILNTQCAQYGMFCNQVASLIFKALNEKGRLEGFLREHFIGFLRKSGMADKHYFLSTVFINTLAASGDVKLHSPGLEDLRMNLTTLVLNWGPGVNHRDIPSKLGLEIIQASMDNKNEVVAVRTAHSLKNLAILEVENISLAYSSNTDTAKFGQILSRVTRILDTMLERAGGDKAFFEALSVAERTSLAEQSYEQIYQLATRDLYLGLAEAMKHEDLFVGISGRSLAFRTLEFLEARQDQSSEDRRALGGLISQMRANDNPSLPGSFSEQESLQLKHAKRSNLISKIKALLLSPLRCDLGLKAPFHR